MTYMRKAVSVAAMLGGILLAGAGPASADSVAVGTAHNSPGVLSGNLVQVPVHAPVNVCGNSVNVVGALNPAFGNSCSNGEQHGSQVGWHHVVWHPVGWHHGWMVTDDDHDCC